MPREAMDIMERAWNNLKFSILMAKMERSMSMKLVFLKKTGKLKKLKLLKHYNYRFIKEYEFSPSSTPLFHHYRSSFKKRIHHQHNHRDHDIRSALLQMCSCWGSFRVEGGEYEEEKELHNYSLQALPSVEDDIGNELSLELVNSSEEDYSIDQKAEMFIKRFYEEMRVQRQENVLQLTG
ncbi:hypothetical protein ACHQM5_009154 [Ranunculus cassubicifolius]